jgi:DNA-binding NarL/FixJ family response regulator
VVIVDDQALFCDGVRELLANERDFEVVAEGRHGTEGSPERIEAVNMGLHCSLQAEYASLL